MSITATDKGSGVRLLRLSVEGLPGVEKTIDDNGGKCAPPYGYIVPCKLHVSGSLEYDTAQVPDGDRAVTVAIEDAAGNGTTVYGPRTHTFDNRPPAMTKDPEVAGEAVVGRELRCVVPPTDGQTPSFAFQWRRADANGANEAAIAGATGVTYAPVSGDVGKKLRCSVTATDRGGSTTRTSPLASGPFTNGGTVKAGSGGAGGTGGAGGAGGSVTVAPGEGWQLDAYFARGRRATALARFGSRIEVAGRVRDPSGAPIGGALVEVVAKSGARERVVGTATTGGDGDWSLRLLARTASARLVVRARPRGGGTRAASDLELRVRAGIAFRVTPRRVRPRGLIRFTGRLLGGPVPRRGKVIELRVRGRGDRRWITFMTKRTDKRGRFIARYRLRRGFRNVTYEFQAVAREDGRYPYATGTSVIRATTVR